MDLYLARFSAESVSVLPQRTLTTSVAMSFYGVPADILSELKANAEKLCSPGKGFLAADESAGPWLRAGHAEAAKIPDTAENRAAYRSMCFTTPGLSDYISGVILHWETLFQMMLMAMRWSI
jgi:hypothetical protein